MANNAYCAIALTGGGTGALDSLDGASLADGDVCFVVDAANNNLETYTLNATLGGVAAPPSTVSPTTNAGDKRWELVKGVFKDSLALYDGTNIGLVQLITNILELYSNKTSGVVRVSVTDGASNKETAADFTGGGAARLYYDNSVKLATTATGVTVTGVVSSDNYKFLATLTSEQTDVTGDGTVYAMPGAIWTETFDVGATFSNGTFTAPVTGYYLLGGRVFINDVGASNSAIVFSIVVNSVTYYFFTANATAIKNISDEIVVCGSSLFPMTAAQTATLGVAVFGGTKTVDVVKAEFWGHILT